MDPREFQDTVDREMKRVDKGFDSAGHEFTQNDSRARTALVYFTTMLFVSSILLLVVSGYAVFQFAGSSWASIIGQGASYLGIAAGVLCFVSAVFGCAATRCKSRALLCCSLLFSLVFLVVQIAAAAGMVAYSYTLSIGTTPSASLTLLTDVVTNNVLLSLYQQCCTGCPPSVVQCTNPNMGAYINGTNANCAAPLSNCTFVAVCSTPGQSNCFVYTQQYLSQVTNGVQMVPPITISPRLCTTLSGLSTHGHKIVGPATSGSCGGGNPINFFAQVAGYLEHVLGIVGVVFVLVAIIQAFIVGLALYIICRPTCTGKSGFEDEMTGLASEDSGEGVSKHNNNGISPSEQVVVV